MKTLLSLTLLLAATAAMLTSGCTMTPHVPATKLGAETDEWKVSIESPKDTRVEDLEVVKNADGVHVSMKLMTATNSPNVIKETGKAQAAIIDAHGNVLDKAGNVIGKVVDGVVTYFAQ